MRLEPRVFAEAQAAAAVLTGRQQKFLDSREALKIQLSKTAESEISGMHLSWKSDILLSMIFSLAVYMALIAVLVYGSVLPGKHSFNADFLSAEASHSAKGIAAICIMLHHIAQANGFQESGELSVFKETGFLFVGIFFFYSGYGLLKSLRTKPLYLQSFFKKRILSVIVPLYVMNGLYAVFNLIAQAKLSASQWILSLSGLVLINDQAWFLIAILIQYAVFYVSFSVSKTDRRALVIITAAVIMQMAFFIFWGHFAWWAGERNWWTSGSGWSSARWWMQPCALWFQGEWWVNSTVMFPVGIAFAMHETKIVSYFKKSYWIKLAALFALTAVSVYGASCALSRMSYWSEFSSGSMGRLKKAVCLLAQTAEVFFFVLLTVIFKMKQYAVNGVTRFFGSITLEFYLMQRMAIRIWSFVLSNGQLHICVFALLVFSTSVVLAVPFHFINTKILFLLKRGAAPGGRAQH